MIAQRLSLHAVCATAREQIAVDVDGTEVIFDPPQAVFLGSSILSSGSNIRALQNSPQYVIVHRFNYEAI